MEGIKEAIAYITGLAVKAEDPKTVEINGKTYCTKDLVRMTHRKRRRLSPQPLSPHWWTTSKKTAKNCAIV